MHDLCMLSLATYMSHLSHSEKEWTWGILRMLEGVQEGMGRRGEEMGNFENDGGVCMGGGKRDGHSCRLANAKI